MTTSEVLKELERNLQFQQKQLVTVEARGAVEAVIWAVLKTREKIEREEAVS